MIPKATEIVKQAIEADNAGDYEKALPLYRRALEYFLTGLKYETNKAAKDQIMDRVSGYMRRAEELKSALDNPAPKGGGGGAATKAKGDGDKDGDDKSKMRDALSASIISEKPNVKWEDVAGLEQAKEALKEAVILPTKFPQLFTGKRRPWKGNYELYAYPHEHFASLFPSNFTLSFLTIIQVFYCTDPPAQESLFWRKQSPPRRTQLSSQCPRLI